MIATIKATGLDRATVGVCGQFPDIDKVFAALPQATFPIVGQGGIAHRAEIARDFLQELRAQKSEWELRRLASAREVAGVAAAAFTEAARPGESLHKAVADAKYAASMSGYEDPTVYSVYVGGGQDPWAFAEDGGGDRTFEAGELVSYEMNTRVNGYFCQYPGCFTVGEPSELQSRVVGVATDAYEAVRDALQPGMTGDDLWRIGLEVVEAAGLRTWGQFGHGMGLGMAEGLRIWAGDPGRFVDGCCFVLHAAVVDPGHRAFALVGDILVLKNGMATCIADRSLVDG